MQLVDSHTHLDHIEDLEGALDRVHEAGVGKIITVGTTIAESKNAANLALSCSRLRPEGRSARGPGLDIRTTDLEVYATAGIHPKDGKDDVERLGIDELIHRLKTIAQSSKKVVAIGECGLDYYVTDDPSISEACELTLLNSGQARQLTTDEEKEFQRELFKAQIKLADDLKLPVVIHCRNGWDEIFKIISNFKYPISNFKLSGVFHSWTGNWETAKKALDLGFYISFSGIVTFRNAPAVQDTARRMPLDKMLIETDSPFLAPEPKRGQKNEPGNVKIIAQFIADIRGMSFDDLAAKTSQNAQRLFNLL